MNRQVIPDQYRTSLPILVSGVTGLLLACSSPEPRLVSVPEKVENKLVSKTQPPTDDLAVAPRISKATSLKAYQREIAVHISQHNSDKIYVTNPQAMLRSVIVIKFSIDAKGVIISRDMLRSNRDSETEKIAMQSLLRLPPLPVPPSTLLKQGKLELIETWLFNSDGRFQLRTIALPQLGE